MRNKHKNNKLSYYGKILLAISFTLFIYGIVLDLKNRIQLFDPKDDVVTVNGNYNGEYTSIDTTVIHSNPDIENESKTDDNNVNNDVNNKQINNNYQGTIDAANEKMRNSIQKKYSITVKYGEETNGYIVGGLPTAQIKDSAVANVALNNLNKVLSQYPKNIFKEINNGGIPLTIYLIDSFSDESVTGATDSNYSYANISIAVAYPFEESFYHESYHYLERYILKKGLSYSSETWNSYNPYGFSYGVTVNDYSYKSTFSENSYFVNNYAQTSPEEDRASTFEYMMASSKASCLNNGKPVWKKADLMSITLDAAFDSVSPNVVEYWERFL